MRTQDRLRDVFVNVLELASDADVTSLKYRDVEEWDSVGHMALVAAIEDEFEVQFDTDQVIDMSSFQVALEMLQSMPTSG